MIDSQIDPQEYLGKESKRKKKRKRARGRGEKVRETNKFPFKIDIE